MTNESLLHTHRLRADGNGEVSSPIDEKTTTRSEVAPYRQSVWHSLPLQPDPPKIDPEGKSRTKTPARRQDKPQPQLRKC